MANVNLSIDVIFTNNFSFNLFLTTLAVTELFMILYNVIMSILSLLSFSIDAFLLSFPHLPILAPS